MANRRVITFEKSSGEGIVSVHVTEGEGKAKIGYIENDGMFWPDTTISVKFSSRELETIAHKCVLVADTIKKLIDQL